MARRRLTLIILAAGAALLALVLITTAAAGGKSPVTVTGGSSILTTDQAQTFVELWGAGGVVIPVKPSTISLGEANVAIPLPVTGGTIDPATLHGVLRLS